MEEEKEKCEIKEKRKVEGNEDSTKKHTEKGWNRCEEEETSS
jgi:hypothetical protein